MKKLVAVKVLREQLAQSKTSLSRFHREAMAAASIGDAHIVDITDFDRAADGHETFRRNGLGVKTPVWFTQDNGTLYIRTVAGSGKVKRFKNNDGVRIVPCEANGTPTGEWIAAHAVEVTDPESADLVRRLLERSMEWFRSRHLRP